MYENDLILTYKPMTAETDTDIPYISSILQLPEISAFINIDNKNYWHYVTQTKNVFYFKILQCNNLVATTHIETSNKTLYMDIMVIPQFQRKGIATVILRDIISGKLQCEFDKIEVAIDERNIASIRLFEKMNFKFTSKENELLNYTYYLTKENTI